MLLVAPVPRLKMLLRCFGYRRRSNRSNRCVQLSFFPRNIAVVKEPPKTRMLRAEALVGADAIFRKSCRKRSMLRALYVVGATGC
jgi:hypothetical protein